MGTPQTASTVHNHCPFVGSVQMHNRLYIKHSYEHSLWREVVVNIEITQLQMCDVRPLMNQPGSMAGPT